ncbi:MAG: hypothetical protein GWP91_18045 [Rhodobacterales bacterium]|nr:hypothetical protein [Rhodobacterales bacterium]
MLSIGVSFGLRERKVTLLPLLGMAVGTGGMIAAMASSNGTDSANTTS